MKPVFCPRCHKRINPPKFLLNGGANIQGNIKLKCGDPKCVGETIIKQTISQNNNGNLHSS
jgi:hypothetical protein